jgi:acyl carrier protein
MNSTELKQRIFAIVAELSEQGEAQIGDDTPLLGDGRVLDSMKLVELCLALEDMAAELDSEFDWTSDSAMSRSRSMFRTAGTLASEFISQTAPPP